MINMISIIDLITLIIYILVFGFYYIVIPTIILVCFVASLVVAIITRKRSALSKVFASFAIFFGSCILYYILQIILSILLFVLYLVIFLLPFLMMY